MQKALLNALLLPNEKLAALQESRNFTELMMLQEECKTLPFGAVWEEYCVRQIVPKNEDWYQTVVDYENEVLKKRA